MLVAGNAGYNLLSKYAIKIRNKFYLICNAARSEMTLNDGIRPGFVTKSQQFIIFSMNMGENRVSSSSLVYM